LETDLSRRTFLRLAAVTSAAAAGCGDVPSRELMPYVIPDENVIPGVPSFYASACRECAAGCAVVARVREGRVIKLEGNPFDPISEGALCARGQAALQGLYNPDRLQGPHQRHPDGRLVPVAWDAAFDVLADRLRAAAAAGPDRVAFLGPSAGPTMDTLIGRWLRVWGSERRLSYDALGDDVARSAALRCFGRADLPVYQLDAADVVVSFGADFLETWRSPIELTRQFAAFRAPRRGAAGLTMGRATYVGPRFGLTAANCDDWLAARPGTEADVAMSVLHVVARSDRMRGDRIDVVGLQQLTAAHAPDVVAARTGLTAAQIGLLARRFGEADAAVALAGTEDAATHVAANLLNAVTGNIGKTVRFPAAASPPAPSGSGDVASFMEALRGGAVDVLLIGGANPIFTMSPVLHVRECLQRVSTVVWCGEVPDETAELAHLLLPVHHTLESWSDATPRPGVTVLGQPVMQPVFDTKPLGDILIASAGTAALGSTSTADAVLATWRDLHARRHDGTSFDLFWEQARRRGGVFEETPSRPVTLRPEALGTPISPGLAPPDGLTLVAFPHVFLGDGRGADKPWLQETPEPVSQIVWDTWAEIDPDTAARLGIEEGTLVALASAHGAMEVPAHLSNTVAPDVVAVPFGQGHTAYGRYARGRGDNPWRLLPLGGRVVAVEAKPTAGKRALVTPLGVSSMMKRPIVEAVRLEDLRSDKTPARRSLEVPEPNQIRPEHVYPKHQWGMTIDLNACTGCSACVTACYAENNVPIVGKEEVERGHIMSWIRIERFVPDGPDAPPLYLAPMLCQQCDHAPCEPVCPVFASYHTEEGLNGQVYNRCIGTRYCNNNCPYKVRRFNWFKADWPAPLHLQLNPDVTVRGAGVMEKCTFCVQRIRAAEMDASAEQRPVRDGEAVTACMQACPAKAITFGDMKDAKSAMMRERTEHRPRGYRALEELGTEPAIVYLRQVYRRPEDV
jgi:molybdopterin-containing oxidoreductase family iron-sulfur binding subunit